MLDALALHDHLGSLKPLFADPSILKVAQALGAMMTTVHLWAASLAHCCTLPTGSLVLQVLHGGDNDCLWLQRDAHLYLANVFDTDKASRVSKLRSIIRRPCKHCLHPAFSSSNLQIAQHYLSEGPEAQQCTAHLPPEHLWAAGTRV